MYHYIDRVPDAIFDDEFRDIVIDALNNNAYISCEYDYSVFDRIDYYTLVDKKTKKVIKKYLVDVDYNGNDAKEDL